MASCSYSLPSCSPGSSTWPFRGTRTRNPSMRTNAKWSSGPANPCTTGKGKAILTEDELDRIRREDAEARQLLLDLLRAPWNRMTPYAITRACEYLKHPDKHEGEPLRGCACGKRKDQLRVKPAGRETA